MADVNLIIRSLDTIATATYLSVTGQPSTSSRKTARELAFDGLTGSAEQLKNIFMQNPKPNSDQRENIAAQFATMKAAVDNYCVKGSGTESVLKAFNDASTEWEVLRQELAG